MPLRAAILFLTLPLAAQTPHLIVRTASNQTTFHLGERIPLELAFTGPDDQTFGYTNKGYDRSGRMDVEHFEVSPASGAADPFPSHGWGFGGGLSSNSTLSSQPTLLHLNLNEWVRFDQPGDYTVTITSERAFPWKQPAADRYNKPYTLKAEAPLHLHIIPATPAWQHATFLAARDLVAQSSGSIFNPDDPARPAAADIRFLATPEAVHFLVDQLRPGTGPGIFPAMAGEVQMGLINLPPALRELALKDLHQRLDDPSFPISNSFLYLLSDLQSNEPPDTSNFAASRARSLDAYRAVLASLSRKQGIAQAQTASTLAIYTQPGLPPAEMAEAKSRIGSALAASLSTLTSGAQQMNIAWHWDLLQPYVLPATIRELALQPVAKGDQGRADLKLAALKRWYESDPQAARTQILREFASPQPTLDPNRLSFFPSEPLPEAESIWIQALTAKPTPSDPVNLAHLLAHYGTGAYTAQIASRVSEELPGGVCGDVPYELAYLVRFSPDVARPILHQALLPEDTHSNCRASLPSTIAEAASGPALVEAALPLLNDLDPQAVSSTARFLFRYGDASTRKPLLDRYLRWSEEWASRPEELEQQTAGPNPHFESVSTGQALGQALLANPGFLPDPELTREVLAHCVTETVCSQLRGIASRSAPPYNLALRPTGRGTTVFALAQYELNSLDQLENKLAQYPAHTSFELIPQQPPDPAAQRLETKVRALFTKQDMSLTTQPLQP